MTKSSGRVRGLMPVVLGAGLLLPGSVFLGRTAADQPSTTAPAGAAVDPGQAVPLSAPGTAKAKLPIPSPAQQQEAFKLISEVHGADLAAAKTAAQKIALGDRILQEAVAEQNDMPGKYVSFQTALDLSTAAGDLTRVNDVVDEMGRCFAVDTVALQADGAKGAFKSLGTGADRISFVGQAVSMADDAQAADDYGRAKVLSDLCKLAAGSGLLKSQVDGYADRLALRTAAYGQVAGEVETLKSKPADEKASADVGRFYCSYKNDWEAGLPLLAKGDDSRLKALALIDLKLNDVSALVQTADGWWQLGEDLTGDPRRCLLGHAAMKYRLALPSLTGLTREKADKRIKEAAADPVLSLSRVGMPFRAQAVEYACSKDQPLSRIMDAGSGFCVLGYLSGYFQGYGETASVSVADGDQWVANCRAATKHLNAHFIAYKTKPYREPVQTSFFEWRNGQPKVKMISKEQGICLLTGISGHFAGKGESVQITCESDGYWYLSGTSGQKQLSATAVAISFGDVHQVAVEGRSYSWKEGDGRVRVMRDGDGICGLVDVGGRFGPEGNEAGLRLDADGYWYLEGKVNSATVQAKAAVFRYPTR
jgi:hypothetical protein